MAGNIKGITIEFDGNTTKLSKALQKVRNESRSVDKELSYINKSLKFNPKNVDLLRQKQTVLKEAIKQSKENLEKLKTAQKELDAKGVDRNSDAYRELERQIIATEGKLREYEKQARDLPSAEVSAHSEAIKEMGQKWQAVGSKIKTAGDNLTKYVTMPLLAVAGASGMAWKSFDEGLDIVIKKTGATGDQVEEFSENIKNLSTSIPTDFATAGTAIGEVNTRFGLTGKSLEDLSGQFIKFADITDTDVNTAIGQTQKALTAYGLGAEDAGAFLDRMAKVSQETGVSVEKLQTGIVQNASAFQEMGLDIDQAATFMGRMEKSGVNADTVLGGLRKAFNKATQEGKPFNEALQELQDSMENNTSDMESMQKAQDLFGKSWQDIYRAVQDGTLTFDDLAGAVSEAGDTVSNTFSETKSPVEEFQTTINDLKITGMELAQTALPYVEKALEKVKEVVETLREKWESLSPGQQDMILKIAGIVAVVGPLLSLIGSLVMTIGTIMTVGAPLLALISGFAVPIMAAIAAIAGLISAGVLLYKNWDKVKAKAAEIKETIIRVWNETKAKVSSAVSTLVSTVTSRFTALKAKVSSIWQGIKNAIVTPINTAKQLVSDAIAKIRSIFPINIGKIFSGVKLPHFRISGGEVPWGIGGMGKKPSVSIDWYKQGAIFSQPTLFNTRTGLKGVGEAGAEAVLPLDLLWANMNSMADNIVNGVVQGVRMGGAEGNITIPVYLYPSGPKMDEIVVRSYDRGKRRLG